MNVVSEHLSKRFGEKPVLRDVGFTFESGKIYGLLGRNGAGKTTLFNCLNRDINADGGSFYLEEGGVRRAVQAGDIGYVLSTPAVPEFLTGREFLKFFLDINPPQEPKSIDGYFDDMRIAPDDRDKLLKDYSHSAFGSKPLSVCSTAYSSARGTSYSSAAASTSEVYSGGDTARSTARPPKNTAEPITSTKHKISAASLPAAMRFRLFFIAGTPFRSPLKAYKAGSCG